MFVVNASNLPTEITDFAFDQLPDYVRSELRNKLDMDYSKQTVHIDTGDMAAANEVKETVTEKCDEKVRDMIRETQSGYDVGFTEDELQEHRSAIHRDIITLENA